MLRKYTVIKYNCLGIDNCTRTRAYMRKILQFVLLTTVFCVSLFALEGKISEGADAESQLAHVAIMTFINASNSANHEYVEKSLPDAINTAMRERFEFKRQSEAQVNEVAVKFKHQNGEYAQQDAQKIAKETQSDILIYGSFRLNESQDKLILHAVIYNAAAKQVIGTVEEEAEQSAKLFKSIDNVASSIVTKIYQFTLAAERKKGGDKAALKVLVLVPTYTNAKEEQAAIKELDVLKEELKGSFIGRYLTIYEFYEEYHVTQEEREKATQFAKNRDRARMISWLDGYGVKDAFIVLVSNSKVNITPVAQGKIEAQVSYAVNARLEDKKISIAKAQKTVTLKSQKIELTVKSLEATTVTLLHIGLMGGKGILDAGNNLGVLTGVSAHLSTRLWWDWFQPQVRFDGYFGLPNTPVNYLLGGALSGGIGHTFLYAGSALTPYVMGGIFSGVIKNTATSISYLLPTISGGLTYTYFIGTRWGVSFNGNAQYVFDTNAPALFFTGTIAWVFRM